MNKHRNSRKSIFVIMPIVLIISAVLGMLFYQSASMTRSTNRVIQILEENAVNTTKSLNSALDAQYSLLEVYAASYSAQQNEDIYAAIPQMNIIQETSAFYMVSIALSDGNAYTSAGTSTNVANREYFKQSMNGNRAIEYIVDGKLSSTPHFNLSVPIFRDDKVIGVVFGHYWESDIKNLINSESFNSQSYSFICDENGDLLVGSDNAHYLKNDSTNSDSDINVFNLFTSAQFINGCTLEKIKEDFSAGKSGIAIYSFNGQTRYGVYQSCGFNNWVIFNVVSGDVVIRETEESNTSAWIMLGIVILFSSLAIFLIIIAEKRNRQKLAKNEKQITISEANARLQQEKLEFALAHSSTMIWEYDINSHEVTRNSSFDDNSILPQTIANVPDSLIESGYIHPDFVETFMDFHKKIDCGEKYTSVELQAKNSTGAFGWVKLEYIAIFDDDGKPVRAIGVSNDISQQKAAEQRYRDELTYRRLSNRDTLISYRVNVSKNIIEDSTCYDNRVEKLTQLYKISELCNAILCTIPDISERQRVSDLVTADAMMRNFAKGKTNCYEEYRRDFGQGRLCWVSVTINIMRSPTSDDIIAFIYTRDINEDKILDIITRKAVKSDYDFVAYLELDADITYVSYLNSRQLSDSNENLVLEKEYTKSIANLANFSKQEENQDIANDISIAQIRNELEKSEVFTYFFKLKSSDGVVYRKMLHYSYIDKNQGLVLITRSDITEVYQEEQRKNKLLSEALETAEKAKNARGDFLSHMSHEIRTPLNGIKGMLDLIKENPSENLQEYLDKAIISTKHLTGLINDILDMSKIDSGKLALNKSYLYSAEFASYIDAIIAPQAKERNIEFVTYMPPCPHDYIFVDGNRLKQIVINLLSNAVKYTPCGGRIDYSVVSTCDENEILTTTFTVQDNGIGMSEEFLKTAFEPFTQEDSSFAKTGSGLGLSITKRLVEMMDSKLVVESTPNVGTKVSFSIKVQGKSSPEKNQGSIIADKLYNFNSLNFTGKRALIVDDHSINLAIAENMLKIIGLTVETATNGEEALNAFKNSETGYFDIIFMDIMMPIMDGLTATKALRKLDRTDAKTVTIVAMTANAFAEDVHKSLENGMNFHLSKPFEKEQILQILAEAFYGDKQQ